MNTASIAIDKVLENRSVWHIIDVRSPGEFLAGHIPGAINIPLFSDDERAQVGTLYKQTSPESAMEKGLSFVGPKMASLLTSIKAYAQKEGKNLLIHCWRGGKRSKAVHWLCCFAGVEATLLQGGYKTFRNEMQAYFTNTNLQINMLGGYTGSGKTEVLAALAKKGQQIIDLEQLANHKGSAFGSIGEASQPTTEQFENNLFMAFKALDPKRPIWLENESKSIGKVNIPVLLWKKMRASVLYTIQVDKDVRLQRVLKDYAGAADISRLKTSFEKIQKRLGGLAFKQAMEALDDGRLKDAAAIALDYYDKSYTYQIGKWSGENSILIHPCNAVDEISNHLLEVTPDTTYSS